MADTTVKFFHSAMVGAPTLSGTAGAMLAVLDACLVNGFGSGTLDSLVIAGGVATATRAGGHSQEANSVALIAGATVTGGSINGEKKVLSTTATSFTFDATGLADQTATGTITAKLAPAGWAKTYSGTNKAAYKPTDVTATGCLVRVDDAATQDARLVGYETMSDVDTGTGPFPSATQQSGGNYWTKSSAANATANPWFIAADGRCIIFGRAFRGGNSGLNQDYEISMFGDLVPSKSGDAYACVLSGNTSSQAGSSLSSNVSSLWNPANSNQGMWAPRSYTGLGSSTSILKNFANPFYNVLPQASGSSGHQVPFPNGPDGGLYVVPLHATEEVGKNYRGQVPGFYCVPQNVVAGQFATRDAITGVTGLTGKVLKAATVVTSLNVTCFIDITGPWR